MSSPCFCIKQGDNPFTALESSSVRGFFCFPSLNSTTNHGIPIMKRAASDMSSGSYIPPPVKAVPIPKKSGGIRVLGVPTVSDRIAQTAVKLVLEPVLDPLFHPDSYGYRPGKSAHDALEITRKRCWKYDWVVEFDIRGLFDNIDHQLLMRAVRKHCENRWVLLYIERWLTAPLRAADGDLCELRWTPFSRPKWGLAKV